MAGEGWKSVRASVRICDTTDIRHANPRREKYDRKDGNAAELRLRIRVQRQDAFDNRIDYRYFNGLDISFLSKVII